ncbi:hypothetical protein FOXYSP1_05809 [Fusarium oxysporum f. sp. phaseoli]
MLALKFPTSHAASQARCLSDCRRQRSRCSVTESPLRIEMLDESNATKQ